MRNVIGFDRSRRIAGATLAIVLIVIAGPAWLGAGAAQASEVIVLRSGNATPGNPDPAIRMLVGAGGAPLSLVPFTSAEFDAACAGPNAIVTTGFSSWLPQLACDPDAQWIGIDAFNTPASALYCYEFEVETCCIEYAALSFCWATDDALGDPAAWGGGNPDGVYLNGVAVSPSIFGGSYAAETIAPTTDVTGLLQCGTNRLQIYNRDAGFVVSGVLFSATLDIRECTVPVDASSWGAIKSLYR